MEFYLVQNDVFSEQCYKVICGRAGTIMGDRSYFHFLVTWGALIECIGREKRQCLQCDPL